MKRYENSDPQVSHSGEGNVHCVFMFIFSTLASCVSYCQPSSWGGGIFKTCFILISIEMTKQ